VDAPAHDRLLSHHGPESGYVFALGRLNRRKDLAGLAGAYAALREGRVTGAPLGLAGKPDWGAARSCAPCRVPRWAGVLPDADLPAFYAGARCFAHSPRFEEFGPPLLEAMACGCPVVSSDRAALPEVVADAGLLGDLLDADGLAQTIARLLGDPDLRATLRARGLPQRRAYAWTATGRRTLAVYRAGTGEP
jgi:alpha-1,3-rhamnosyl/mannosyltransferase